MIENIKTKEDLSSFVESQKLLFLYFGVDE